ncbi:MAG: Flp pilus assembly protein CpaB [Candidatus Omnitrophica bacterium]|nr:Flp pilus assembly protein CpaB [Candidatus Omnitrophota bacterium]
MDKRVMINIIAGVLISTSAIIFILQEMKKRDALIQDLIRKGEIVDVVVARTDIPKETTISSEMVEMKRVRRQTLQPGDLTSEASAIGKFAETNILKDQHINSNMIRALNTIKYLSQSVPQGMRALTIPVDKLSAVEGLLKPGDKVDVVGTFPVPVGGGQQMPVVITVFQGVKVLATNKNISPYMVTNEIQTVTLALMPDDIRTFTYILGFGQVIRLVLRGPLDTTQEYGYSAVSFDVLMRKLGLMVDQPIEVEKPKIDVYRGQEIEETEIAP